MPEDCYPRQPRTRHLPALALICLFPGLALGQILNFGDIEIHHAMAPAGYSSHGYNTRLVTLTNRAAIPHKVQLTYSDRSTNSYRYEIDALSKTVVIGPGATATLRIPVWAGWDCSSMLAVSIDGNIQKPAQYVTSSARMTQPQENTLSILAQNTITLQAACERYIKKSRIHITHNPTYATYDKWSDHWLDYSSFDMVLLAGSEWDLLNRRQRAALRTWVRCGGTLVFVASLPELDVDLNEPAQKMLFAHAYDGFGVMVYVPEAVSAWNAATEDQLFALAFDSAQPWRNVRTTGWSAQRPFGQEASVRGFFLLMILFSIVLGPLNLYLLARYKKRIWLLWTVPALSVLTALFIFLYAFLNEGFGLRLHQEAVTILDETNHRAESLAQASVYSTLTQAGGLHFDPESDIYVEAKTSSRQWETIDLSTDQHLAAGWLKARIHLAYFQRKSESRRERLTVSPGDADTLTVVNGLGAPIIGLYITDARGRLYSAGRIEAGLKGTATAVPDSVSGAPDDLLRRRYVAAWKEAAFVDASLSPGHHDRLGPNRYLALLEGAPFIEQPTAAGKNATAKSIVYGIRGEP